MSFSFVLADPYRVLPLPIPPALDNLQVSVRMQGDGPLFLRDQLERDIAAKAFAQASIPFTLFDLLEIERLVPITPVNMVMSHHERKLVALYVAHHLRRVEDAGDQSRTTAYDYLLSELLERSTLITFTL